MARIAGNQSSKGKRHPTDLYPTDQAWTRVLLDHQPLEGPVWECAAGTGEMASVLEEKYEVLSTDLTTGEDFLTSTRRAPSIVTNPPYRILDEFVLHGLRQTDHYLCLLVGWHYVGGGAGRSSKVWVPTPPNRVMVIPERMKVNGKSSQFNHAWVVWDVQEKATKTCLEWRSVKIVR